MRVHSEIMQITKKNQEIKALIEKLSEKIDTDGIDFQAAYFVENCIETNGGLLSDGKRLDNSGLVDNDYYCHQTTGYLEDDFHGTMYFKTRTPGLFIAVPFDM